MEEDFSKENMNYGSDFIAVSHRLYCPFSKSEENVVRAERQNSTADLATRVRPLLSKFWCRSLVA